MAHPPIAIVHEGDRLPGPMPDVAYGPISSPMGPIVITLGDDALTGLSFLPGDDDLRSSARREPVTLQSDTTVTRRWEERLFAGNAPIPVALHGTAFQRRVWRALLDIPAGQTQSYGQLAARIGHPRAARAVGGAVGANPIAWFIPCHRVITSQGGLGGYMWGPTRKKAILDMEGYRFQGVLR